MKEVDGAYVVRDKFGTILAAFQKEESAIAEVLFYSRNGFNVSYVWESDYK